MTQLRGESATAYDDALGVVCRVTQSLPNSIWDVSLLADPQVLRVLRRVLHGLGLKVQRR